MHWKIQLFRISRVAGLSLALLGLGWGESVPVRAQDAAVDANSPATTIALKTTSEALQGKRLAAPVNERAGNEDAGNDGAGISTRDHPPTIVIGFVGGFVRRGNAVHSPVKLAARLRQEYPTGVHVEVFENHHREDAYRRVLELLDAAHRGKPNEDEKRNARVIIYGMSWGGSETVMLARELQKQNISVLLTVQVDSVGKLGQDDGAIPANVSEAANFYQTNGLLHGREEIHAANSNRTRILGNFQYEYKTQPVNCGEYPWWDRLFAKYHTEIECDPAVWSRVEALIRSRLPAVENKSAS
jgi:hypothetical protein